MFQSTRPRGARQMLSAYTVGLTVSIHAPAGGATAVSVQNALVSCFNPRARGGRDDVLLPPDGSP